MNGINTDSPANHWQSTHSRIADGIQIYQNNEPALFEMPDNCTTNNKIKDALQAFLDHSKAMFDRFTLRFEASDKPIVKVTHPSSDTNTTPEDVLPWTTSEESKGPYFFIADGIQFYQNNELGLIEITDNRTTNNKIMDTFKSFLKHKKAIVDILAWRFEARNNVFAKVTHLGADSYTYPADDLPWSTSEESNGLYLFIHGLEGSHSDWKAYKEDVKNKNPMEHIFVPQVTLKGNCGLETAGKPLLEALENYLHKFPGKPVRIIGTSNGGRLAALYIEANLDPAVLGSSPLSVVSLAGVNYGTKLIDNAKSTGLSGFLIHKQLEEEFGFGSEFARKSLMAWKAKQDVWNEQNKTIRHLFCASTEDFLVTDNSSSLPYHETASSTYVVISGESHTSIVDALRKNVLKWLDLNG
ncbi:MAG TPA: hypothetical protein VGP47_08955 [Parachlamydiaceae bacterium]|nr:hypothetical protein [Parachlamydiaceae bacterium]